MSGQRRMIGRVSRSALIAVIDDDESVRVGTASLLFSAGYQLESFSSAEEFLRSGDSSRFACVIADIHMPGMSGIELADQLGGNVPPTPVVLVTAWTGQEVLASFAASNVAFLLRKPFAADRLLRCVGSTMR